MANANPNVPIIRAMTKFKALIGTVGTDVHSVANHLLEKEFRDRGFEVKNLGVAVDQRVWLEETKNFQPDIVLVGSMNGDLGPVAELVKRIKELNFPNLEIVVGGNLQLGSRGESLAPLLKALGANIPGKEVSSSFETISSHCLELIQKKSKVSRVVSK